MHRAPEVRTVFLLTLGIALVSAIARGFWLYLASMTWPVADGVITRIGVERHQDSAASGGHHFRATFAYDFRDPAGKPVRASWSRIFSTEEDAREFSERELPVGTKVAVRFNAKNSASNGLELDSWTYRGDRPVSLSIQPDVPAKRPEL
jgi:hypothetical protein